MMSAAHDTAVEFTTTSWRERLSFGAGDLATNIAWGAMSTYIVFFYTEVIGVAAAAIGTIMLFSRLLDGVADVAMGAVVDRTRSKLGKARFWIVWLCAPFTAALVLVFAVPDAAAPVQLVYIAISYNVLALLLSGVVIPYGTLNTRITRDFNERSLLNVVRMFGATLGLLIVTVCALPVVNAFGGTQTGWILAFVLFGLVGLVLYLVTFFNTRERIVDPVAVKQPGFGTSIRLAVRNRYWLLLFGMFLAFSIAESLYTAGSAYYAKYLLGQTEFVAVLSFMLYIPAFLGILFMQPLYRRFGKVRPMIIGAALFIIGSVVIAADPQSVTAASAGTIIRGIGRIPIFGAIWGMLPDTIEYGEWKLGRRIEGVLYSAGSMGQKAGYGFGAAILGGILGAAGYNGLAATQGDEVLGAIQWVFVYLPAVLFAVLIVLCLAYRRMERLYPTLERELADRRRASASSMPS